MNKENNIKKVYEQIHAPEALLGKVMEMKKDTFKFRNSVKFVAAAVAALALTLITSNGICYAATGETLFTKIKICFDGKDVTTDITWEEKDGNMVGTFEMDLDYEDEVTGEPKTAHGTIEIMPDGMSVEDVDGLDDVVALSVTVPEEGGCISIEDNNGELNLSVDVNKAE